MQELLNKISPLITADNVALLSVFITVLIYVCSRQLEIRYKKLDDKKIQYLKLIDLTQKNLSDTKKNKNGEIIISKEMQKLFFDTGASLLLYGSKKVYRQYLLFREFTTNPLIRRCKYYDESIVIYIMAEIFRTMRKEVGLSYFNSIGANEALAFFVNDISSNPVAKEKAMDAQFRIKMIKLELAMMDRVKLIYIKTVYTNYIKPVISGMKILCIYILVIPLGFLVSKLFPKLEQQFEQKFEAITDGDKVEKRKCVNEENRR